MSIGRSLTKKGTKYLERVAGGHDSKETNKRASMRGQISAPVALISTTNMISYTSPSLRTSQSYSSISPLSVSSHSPSSSTSSGSDSDSVPSSPSEAVSPNHLSTYFTTAPAIPAQSPARSLSTKSSKSTSNGVVSSTPRPSIRRSASTAGIARTGSKSLRSSAHPFGVELAKVAELAEDLSASSVDADEEFMVSHGLQKFGAQDYEAEIWGGVFEGEWPKLGAGWI